MRLAKLLAQRGVAARRKAEELIAEGAVTVNGQVAEVVTFVDPNRDVVLVRGKPLPGAAAKAYYALYKPAGYLTSRGGLRGRKSIFGLCGGLPVRVEPVGRLDYDTEGVLLLTNDGHMAHALTHPSAGVPKRYAVQVQGMPDRAALQAIAKGVALEDGVTAPARARIVGTDQRGNAKVDITVTEGRNRLVRRMLLAVGHPVLALRRESFAGITLRSMKRGEVRELTTAEVERLRGLAGGNAR
ncbi:MAG TPA: pseudouridine synthase [Dehalococcoidia bacterium]|nr:pseudouridine synthase [Dehalococcoidia bacterium]